MRDHEVGVWEIALHERRVRSSESSRLEESEKEEWLVPGSTDRKVRIWDLSTGRNTHTFTGHSSTVRCLAVVRPTMVDMGDGRMKKWPKRSTIVTGSRDSTLCVWKMPKRGDGQYRDAVDGNKGDDEEAADDSARNPFFARRLKGHPEASPPHTGGQWYQGVMIVR